MFRGAISEILLDDSFTIETTESQACLQLAHKTVCLLSAASIEQKEFAEWLHGKLTHVLKEAKSDDSVKEDSLWKNFYKFRSSEEFISKWKSFLVKLNLEPNPLFYQHVTQELFEAIIGKSLVVKEAAISQSTATLKKMW